MKKIDLKDKDTQKKFLAAGLFIIAIALFIVFLIMAGKNILNPVDNPADPEESNIPITGDSTFVDDSSFSPVSIQYKGESGITYTIGSDEIIEIENRGTALPLNPSASNTDFKIGFYFDPAIGSIISEYEDVDYATSDDKTFFIGQWTDQYIYPAKYETAEQYGVAYAIDERAVNSLSESDTEARIAVRTIDLTNKRFLDAFFIMIGFDDNGKATFTRTASADISHTNPSLDRNWIIETALMKYNDDGWSIGTTTSKDGTVKNENYNPNEPISTTSRYVVEMVDEMTYSPYILNRGEQGEPDRGIGLGENQFPLLAVTPCYDIGNAYNGLITIYLYPAFLNGGPGLTYLGYSDWNNPDCSPEVTFN